MGLRPCLHPFLTVLGSFCFAHQASIIDKIYKDPCPTDTVCATIYNDPTSYWGPICVNNGTHDETYFSTCNFLYTVCVMKLTGWEIKINGSCNGVQEDLQWLDTAYLWDYTAVKSKLTDVADNEQNFGSGSEY